MIKRKNVALNLMQTAHRDLKMIAAVRGIPLYEVVDEAMTQYILTVGPRYMKQFHDGLKKSA